MMRKTTSSCSCTGRDDAEQHRDTESLVCGIRSDLGTMLIHAFVVETMVTALRRNLQGGGLGVRFRVNLTFVMGATLVALVGHLAEIALWAFALTISGAVADISAAIFIHRLAAIRLWVPISSCRHDGSCWDHLKRLPEC
jgi:hypothetical protein